MRVLDSDLNTSHDKKSLVKSRSSKGHESRQKWPINAVAKLQRPALKLLKRIFAIASCWACIVHALSCSLSNVALHAAEGRD